MSIPTTTKVQTLIFDKDLFTKSKAKTWAKSHGFKYGKVDTKENTYRLRQEEPEEFQPSSFRTISLRPGIQAVIARPWENPGGKTMAKKKAKKKRSPAKKRAPKKKRVPKKKRASKKRAPKKKRASKKKAGKKRKDNPGLSILLGAAGRTLSSSKPCPLWTVWLKTPQGRIAMGQVTAKTKAEAMKKAKAYLRKKFR